MSTSTLTNPGHGGLYGSTHSQISVKGSLLHCRTRINSFWNYGVQNSFLRGKPNITGRGYVKVKAGWLFKGGGADKHLDASVEHSESANEDILIFFFQLDLATRVQVEEEVTKQRNAKKGSTSKTEVQDQAIRILRLRAELQNAVEKENYAVAAELRDEIAKLEAESLEASAKALAFGKVQYAFRLGQKVQHKIFGYRGVICGMDPVCCESSAWMQTANIQSLSSGSNQPFYQVLVDAHVDPDLLVTYVAEENLLAPEKPDLDRFDHPYTSFLFYGVDTAGDFIPVKQLREKYNQPRHEVPEDEDEYDPDRA